MDFNLNAMSESFDFSLLITWNEQLERCRDLECVKRETLDEDRKEARNLNHFSGCAFSGQRLSFFGPLYILFIWAITLSHEIIPVMRNAVKRWAGMHLSAETDLEKQLMRFSTGCFFMEDLRQVDYFSQEVIKQTIESALSSKQLKVAYITLPGG